MHKFLFYNKFIMSLHVSSTVVLIIVRSKLYCTAPGIVTPIGGRPILCEPAHRTATYSVMIPDAL